MKLKTGILALLLLLPAIWSCNNDAAPDCFRNSGTTVLYEVPVTAFENINISEGIELIIAEGAASKVVVETGENLKENISAEVVGNRLYIKNAASCNWVRDYNTTKVYVITPALTQIYSASQFAVKSQGVLNFPHLTLQSGLHSATASGIFELEVDSESLTIEDNQSVYYNVSGNVNNLSISFYSGDARFNGSGLMAGNVYVFHRSTNDIIVQPQQEVTGRLYSTGNLVLKSQPAIINVQALYTGRVIYQ